VQFQHERICRRMSLENVFSVRPACRAYPSSHLTQITFSFQTLRLRMLYHLHHSFTNLESSYVSSKAHPDVIRLLFKFSGSSCKPLFRCITPSMGHFVRFFGIINGVIHDSDVTVLLLLPSTSIKHRLHSPVHFTISG
jgi:hypothetical protein